VTANAIRSVVIALRAAGVPFLKIGRALEAAGIPAPGGGKWPMSTLFQITESQPVASDDEVTAANPPRREPTPEPEPPRAAAVHARAKRLFGTLSHGAFKARFTPHLTRALVAYGIDAPERLLFMSEAEIAELPGVGKGAREEIKLYRDSFLPRRRS
jgi:hypothetical protein